MILNLSHQPALGLLTARRQGPQHTPNVVDTVQDNAQSHGPGVYLPNQMS